MKDDDGPAYKYDDLTTSLQGSTILIMGAAGFVGSALLWRLLGDDELRGSIKQVQALIRGETAQAATARLPAPLQSFTRPWRSNPPQEEPELSEVEPKLVVLNGDLQFPGLGLGPEEQAVAQRADIVIHAAGDTRFTLTFADVMGSITDLAYMSSRFSLATPSVKTHIHISTSFVSWFVRPGSTVYEDFIQNNSEADILKYGTHVNTYLHAKTLAEGCVNALFTPQAGRPLHGKVVRIIRPATLGPAVEFPTPGWGAGDPCSPVSAALAAEVSDPDDLMRWMPEEAFLDIVPVDVGINQILALTAAAHQTHGLPSTSLAHPRSHQNPANKAGINVPCYHVATGLAPFYQAHMLTLNMREVRVAKPYISERQLMAVYRPFISKIVSFDTSRSRRVLRISDLQPVRQQTTDTDTAVIVANPEASPTRAKAISATDADRGTGKSNNSGGEGGECVDDSLLGGGVGCSTAANIDGSWADPPIHCGELELDCPRAIQKRWGELGGKDSPGWIGYLQFCRDKMERAGRHRDWKASVA